MVKKAKGKHRLDKFYSLAKEQGYRSRAAFKLIQLNRQFHFLDRCKSLVDLCAAPGGWLQVAQKAMPVSSLIVGIDLVPIKAIRGVRTLVGDITTQKARQAIRKEAGGEPVEVVLHDGAPNVGGAWSSEAYSQSALVLDALKLATDVLAPRGAFVTKIFRSKDYNALLYALKALFERVEATKPAASRNTSAEIFVVCLGYRAPAKIDPRLLDPKHLFQEVSEAPKSLGPDALLRQKVKQKRFRDGYEDGISTTHRATSAAAFILSEQPVEMLGQFSRFVLEGTGAQAPVEGLENPEEAAAFVFLHPATGAEVRTLCGDLQVLGRSEFKQLLKWRLQVRKDWFVRQATRGAEGGDGAADWAAAAEGDDAGQESELDEEEKILAEMDDVKAAAAHRAKKERRRRREAKKKARIRAAQLALGEGIGEESNGPDALFRLAAIKGVSVTAAVGETAVPHEEEPGAESPSSDDEEDADKDADEDSDDARRRYDAETEEALEEAYQGYLQRRGKREELELQRAEALRSAKRARLGGAPDLDGDDASGDGGEGEGAAGAPATFETAPAAPEDEEGDAEEGGGLLVRLDERRAGVPTSAAAVAARWFAQDLFEDANLAAEDDDGAVAAAAAAAPPPGGAAAEAGPSGVDADAEVDGDEVMAEASGSSEDDEDSHAGVGVLAPGSSKGRAALAQRQQQRGQEAPAGSSGGGVDSGGGGHAKKSRAEAGHARAQQRQEAAGFEVVPLANGHRAGGGDEDGSGSDSDDDSDAGLASMDPHSRAEVLALARKMRGGRERQDIMDGAYHRYAFHDDNLPRWFAEDERRHLQPPAVLSREEVEAEKANARAIDARPIKKVAEAKQRKRKRLQTRVSAARAKAEAVMGSGDLSERGKAREVDKLMAQARAGKGAKTGGGKGKKQSRSAQRHAKPGKRLDGRMLADKRQVNAKAKGKAAKGRKGKAGGKGKAAGGKAGGGKGKRR